MKGGDTRTGPRPRDPFERWLDRVMAERREVERLVEALDVVGYDLENHPEHREALANVFRLGHMLSNALALVEREASEQPDWPEFADAVDHLVAFAPSARADFVLSLVEL